MARMLSRSKSLRLLRGGHKEAQQQDSGRSTPLPAQFEVDLDRLKAATPVTRTGERVETPEMLERPRTSGGSADRGKLFHRKVVPTPGHADSTSTLPFPSPAKSATTILYAAEVHEDTGVIGIALGSPTMNPSWNASLHGSEMGTVTIVSANADPPVTPVTTETSQEAAKPKISRWKSIFGRRPPVAPTQKTSFYQLAQSVVPPRTDSHHDHESLDSRSVSRAEESHEAPRSVSPPVFRPEIRESRRLPKAQEQTDMATRPRALTTAKNSPKKPRNLLMRSASSPRLRVKDAWEQAPPVPQVVVTGDSQKLSSTLNDRGLLDVNIPDIKLDRYSVMFGNLLQPTANSNSIRSSSLLVRRQGNSERLKPLNELVAKQDEEEHRRKPQRRATSPIHPKSPGALSLFPSTTAAKPPSPKTLSIYKPRPLQRSKTAPATSPNRQNFPIRLPSDTPFVSVSHHETSHDRTAVESDGLNVKPQLPSPSPSSRHSFDSEISEDVTVIVSSPCAPWKPHFGEPEWEFVSKPSPLAALRSHPAGATFAEAPSSAPLESGAIHQPKTQPVEVAPRSADRIPAPKQTLQSHAASPRITTVGVARSVSVSRASPRSADVLKPTLMRRGTERSPRLSPASGRFIDQKPLTPMLVELKNRKSQLVQLEDA